LTGKELRLLLWTALLSKFIPTERGDRS
jgi:hypothetical protein